jgi:hypothetical protein
MSRFVFFAAIAANAVFANVSLLNAKLFTGFAAIAFPRSAGSARSDWPSPALHGRAGSTGRTSWNGRGNACVTGSPRASSNGFSTSSGQAVAHAVQDRAS